MKLNNYIVLETMRVNQETIEEHMDAVFRRVQGLLSTKGQEYSNNENRLENFLETARMEDITPEVALWNYMLKHIISVRKFVMESGGGITRPLGQWDEKISDIETYLILLRAMVHCRQEIEKRLEKKVEDERKAKESVGQDQ